MKKYILKNLLTNEEIKIHKTTNHPDSSYGQQVWIDDNGTSYGLVGYPILGCEIRDYEPKESTPSIVYVPTLKYINHRDGIVFNGVRCVTLSESELSQVGVSPELCTAIAKSYGDAGYVENGKGEKYYTLHIEVIDKQTVYRQGSKLEYLKNNALEGRLGWILPISKAAQFIKMCK